MRRKIQIKIKNNESQLEKLPFYISTMNTIHYFTITINMYLNSRILRTVLTSHHSDMYDLIQSAQQIIINI